MVNKSVMPSAVPPMGRAACNRLEEVQLGDANEAGEDNRNVARMGASEIDRRALGVALSARDCAVSAGHARRVIAALLYGSSIPETLAARWQRDRQHQADIADRLRLLLFTKVMQETEGGLLLDRVAGGASASGWATQLCRAALPSAARDVRLRQRERPHPAVGAGQHDEMTRGFRSITEVADLVCPVAPDFSDGVVTVIDRCLPGDAMAEAGFSVAAGVPDPTPGQRAGDGGGGVAGAFGHRRGHCRRPSTPARGVTHALRRGGSISDTLWTMKAGVIESVRDPAAGDNSELLDGLMTLLRRAEYLGLLDSDSDRRPDEFWAWLPSVVAGMIERGLPAGTRWQHLPRTSEWQQLTTDDGTGEPTATAHRFNGALSGAVEQINDQIEMSPQPAAEWAPVTATLGEDLLAQLVGVSVSSVRRYATGARSTPQDVAERLHFLALLIADLAGSYNDFGIRRWLNRPRTPLGGRSPASLLGEFDPEGADAAAVANLASALVGAGSA